jgi:hypothetical protein
MKYIYIRRVELRAYDSKTKFSVSVFSRFSKYLDSTIQTQVIDEFGQR